MDNYTWIRWVRAHFDDDVDYAQFCWVCDNIIACYTRPGC